MKRSLLCIAAALVGIVTGNLGDLTSAEEPRPAEVVWQGSVAAGATVDDRGLTVDKATAALDTAHSQVNTGRWKFGFAATWSLAVRWEPTAAKTPSQKSAARTAAKSNTDTADPKSPRVANSKPQNSTAFRDTPGRSATNGDSDADNPAGTNEDATTEEDLSADEEALIQLTNAERKKLNLPELSVDLALMKLARSHSAEMAKLNQIGHEAGGKSFSTRMSDAKYKSFLAGENIARGQNSPQQAVSDWMNSAGHKENIIRKEFTHIGVGIASSETGKRYWTQVFSRP